MTMNRRDLLQLVAIDLAALGVAGVAPQAPPADPHRHGAPAGGGPEPLRLPLTRERLGAAPWRVLGAEGELKDVAVGRTWQTINAEGAASCTLTLTNTGKRTVKVREIIPFSLKHDLPGATALYAESFQMLSQTGGFLEAPRPLGYDEVKHYKVPQPEGVVQAATGVLLLRPPGQDTVTMFAFSSSQRFAGRFLLRKGADGAAAIDVWLDGEGLALAPGQTWKLEEFVFATGPSAGALLAGLATRIGTHHPRLPWPKPPTGWCSWYCFGPKVTAEDVTANLEVIAKSVPELRYVQIDDGYQPTMGDWLETGKAFGGDVAGVLAAIKKRGFEPAIWVAPFIAEAESHVFKQHPDWFVKGPDRKPLASDKVSFGGWRRGPWYVLDGTHPGVQAHFEKLFTTMRKQWGCTYFKLDANFWGMLHGGRYHDPKATRVEAYRRGMAAILRTHPGVQAHFEKLFTTMRKQWGCTYFKLDANFWGMLHGGRYHDPKATRVEAYRRGMAAILRGTGDGFVLGCNHPIWPSFGLVHGSRSSGDIKRTWKRIKQCADENLHRNWQNGTLWWNDSDAVVLTGDELSDDEFQFHATAVFASGGLILSGDDLTKIPPARLAMLKKLVPGTARAARFDDADLRIGRVTLGETEMLCLFNADDKPQNLAVTLRGPCVVSDFWSGASLGRREGTLTLPHMPPHSARLLACKPLG